MIVQGSPYLGAATLRPVATGQQAPLRVGPGTATYQPLMMSREQWRELSRKKPVRTGLFMTGLLLLILSPLAGAIPGPGGVFVFAAGLTLALRNSDWAKRQYVRFKQWQPKAGRWADWGLRRRSARRRETLRRKRQEMGYPPPADEIGQGPIAALIPDPPAKEPEKWSDREGRARRAGGDPAI